MMELLKMHRLCYLATPYSKFSDGIDEAFLQACALAAELIRRGVKIYSPIAHTHSIAIHGRLDPYDYRLWLPLGESMMTTADAMVIGMLAGWERSIGIAHEINMFTAANKPIYTIEPKTLHQEQLL